MGKKEILTSVSQKLGEGKHDMALVLEQGSLFNRRSLNTITLLRSHKSPLAFLFFWQGIFFFSKKIVT